jgi:hypothetical protein
MDSVPNVNNYESIARAIIEQTENNSNDLNLETVLQVIHKIEAFTGCKLYNKDKLTNHIVEISEDNFASEAKKAIWKNLIPQVDFNTLFKSDIEFTLVFKEDDVVILYKNSVITIENLEQIKSELIKNSLKDFPPITELYIDNIIRVISKFISKDISVQYYCVNIPPPYWKLFEIKCRKSNSTSQVILEQCQELEKIVSGQYFNIKSNNIQVVGQAPTQDDDELKAVLMQIEEYENSSKQPIINNNLNNLSDNEKKALEDFYRMEVMSYLNDNEIIAFLGSLEKIDGFEKNSAYSDKTFITVYMKFLLDAVNSMQNKIAKFYYVYKIYSMINNAPWFIESNNSMRMNLSNKINEFVDDLYILQSAELKLCNGVVSTMDKTKEVIDSIEKKLNPNYIPIWKTNNQQNILNQIVNNNYYNYNNSNMSNTSNTNVNNIIIEDSDDEIENYDDNKEW